MKHIYNLLIVILLSFAVQPGWGQARNLQDPRAVIAWNKNLKELTDYSDSLSKTGKSEYLLYLQTAGGVSMEAMKSVLNLEDVVVMGNDIFLCLFSGNISSDDLFKLDIKAWQCVTPKDKLGESLISKMSNNPESVELLVKIGGTHPNTVLTSLYQHTKLLKSVRQPWLKSQIYRFTADSAQIMAIADDPSVFYIQQDFKPIPLANSLAVGYTNAETAHQPLVSGGLNLMGDNVTLGIGDDGNPNHIDYIDRLTSFNPNFATTHGTHTTGTMAGAGLKDQRYQGFAPHAHVIMDLFNGIISNAPAYYNSFGMLATNNSYAAVVGDCNYAGLYDLYSAFLDDQAITLPKVLNIFAAGNDRQLNCAPLSAGYGTVVGAYSTAKDVLTVANIGLTRNIINNTSSVGPVRDGRLKPEITAMGNNLVSTLLNNNYGPFSGTSMACPNVTGAAGLLIQKYKQLHGNNAPDNALVKLLLMNGADDLDLPGPDYKYGFGLLNLGRSLTMLTNEQYFNGSIQTNQQQDFTFIVPANIAAAKIMLYWNDPAAMPGAPMDLINDLDLTVTDPSGSVVYPLVPNPQNVTAAAVQDTDHLNNVEQVTINLPVAGTYAIHVKGYNVAQGVQSYYVAYNLVENAIAFQYPIGGEALISGDNTQYIYWQAPDNANASFALSYSPDNGNSWVTINNNIASDKRAYQWLVPIGLNSSQCLLKLSNGTETVITHDFSISDRPVITQAASANQCPGSFSFSWGTVPNASGYQIYKKNGASMMVVDTTTSNSYTLTGLSPDSVYWVAVAPILDNSIGIRSVAVSYQPNVGNCSLVGLHGDLRLSKIITPQSGRDYTQSALTATSPFKIQIQNLDNQPADHYLVSWQVNNAAWVSQNFTNSVNAADTLDLDLSPLDLSAVGDYTISVAVTNLALSDPVTLNDTLTIFVRHLANAPIDLLSNSYTQNFENLPNQPALIGQSVLGAWTTNHWDFETSEPTGRARSFVNSGVSIQGDQSLSMDNVVNQNGNINGSAQNYFTGTFNLSNYHVAADEVRLTFDYSFSGVPKFDTGNQVWVRGNENDPWLNLYKLQVDTNTPGALVHASSISLNDVLQQAGQDFSTSTQIRFCQRDTSLIEASNYGNGLTIDNVLLSLANNDIQLVGIDSVGHFNCALSNQVSLKVRVYNSMNYPISQIPISYQLDGQTVVSETIPYIPGKDTIEYSFQQTMDLSQSGFHTVSVWTTLPSDNYPQNDSILDFSIRNQPVIDQFPYLENFENGDGNFYTGGVSSSWQYGTPNATRINHAASGTKAWKTNLTGTYNNYEWSYLYSPCYDIAQLQNPTLSFSLATDIENNPDSNTVYDQAYVEYTTNGINWIRLGTAGEGYNWYNNPVVNAWTRQGQTWWHVATIPLPHIQGTFAFRIVLHSDPGATFEGVAIDDIHIYDLTHPIYSGDSLATPLQQSIGTNEKQDFIENNRILASIQNNGNPLSDVSVQIYPHINFVNPDSSQYFLPENFVIQTPSTLSDSALLQLFVTDSAMSEVRNATNCPSCAPVNEIYKMGISYYSDPNKAHENNLLSDDDGGVWTYIPRERITYIPYDQGYRAVFKVGHFSEIWFNSGGPDNNTPLPIKLFDFVAKHYGKQGAQLTWKSTMDEHTSKYYIQRADDSNKQFQTIGTLASLQDKEHQYIFLDTPELVHPYVLYRILYDYEDGNVYNSQIRRLDWSAENGQVFVYPNPVREGKAVNVRWFKGNSNPLNWQIVDYQGRLLKTGTFAGNPYNDIQVIRFDQMGLAGGVYLLKIYTGNESWSFSIVYQP